METARTLRLHERRALATLHSGHAAMPQAPSWSPQPTTHDWIPQETTLGARCGGRFRASRRRLEARGNRNASLDRRAHSRLVPFCEI